MAFPVAEALAPNISPLKCPPFGRTFNRSLSGGLWSFAHRKVLGHLFDGDVGGFFVALALQMFPRVATTYFLPTGINKE